MFVTLYSSRIVFCPEEGGYYTEATGVEESFCFHSQHKAKAMLIREARKLGLKIDRSKTWAFSARPLGENEYIYIEAKKGKHSKSASYC